MTWGPFRPGRDPGAIRADCRCLALAAKILAGPRSAALRHKLFAVMTDPSLETILAAEREFDRLGAVDRRRILASYLDVA